MEYPKFDRQRLLSSPTGTNELLILDQLTEPIERSKIKLVTSPFWLKIGPCPPEFEKKDLMHAVGSTFGGVLRSEIKGHEVNDCIQISPEDRSRSVDELPYSIALKAESAGRQMSKEEDSGNNPKTQEIRNERQMSRDKASYINTTKGSIIVKQKEEQNLSEIVEIQINELEIEKSIDGVEMQQINHHRNSWRHLDKKEIFDTNMPELILGKSKFNQEKLVDIDPYSSIKSMKKKFKAVNGHVVEHATFDFEKVFSQDFIDLKQDISAAANRQAERKQ
ncbi:hypothetical protein CXB51_003333 [Gossypium anomalum]|uniref:DUF4283 domain-containing protein n=1 Tax=Gossypium anomalum TaxID=47600 RepID=A0A8J5ZLB0_9ROSI|nr:hypothetical protein CXB51_003333 [Gossypium anomalum]